MDAPYISTMFWLALLIISAGKLSCFPAAWAFEFYKCNNAAAKTHSQKSSCIYSFQLVDQCLRGLEKDSFVECSNCTVKNMII